MRKIFKKREREYNKVAMPLDQLYYCVVLRNVYLQFSK